MADIRRTILTVEVNHSPTQTAEDIAAILNVSLDEVRKEWYGDDLLIHKFVPLNEWDLPPVLLPVPIDLRGSGFTLVDSSSNNDAPQLQGRLELEGNAHHLGAILNLEGFGLMTMDAGYGGVICLEYYENRVQLLVWADINQDDPTHVICLEAARESNRQEEE